MPDISTHLTNTWKSQDGPPPELDVDLSPLQTRVHNGHVVVPVGDDYVFSNDVLLEGLQPSG